MRFKLREYIRIVGAGTSLLLDPVSSGRGCIVATCLLCLGVGLEGASALLLLLFRFISVHLRVMLLLRNPEHCFLQSVLQCFIVFRLWLMLVARTADPEHCVLQLVVSFLVVFVLYLLLAVGIVLKCSSLPSNCIVLLLALLRFLLCVFCWEER